MSCGNVCKAKCSPDKQWGFIWWVTLQGFPHRGGVEYSGASKRGEVPSSEAPVQWGNSYQPQGKGSPHRVGMPLVVMQEDFLVKLGVRNRRRTALNCYWMKLWDQGLEGNVDRRDAGSGLVII